MRRDEVTIDLYRSSEFWKPWTVELGLASGLVLVGKGWTRDSAYQDAKAQLVKLWFPGAIK